MKTSKTYNALLATESNKILEGELTYHARYWEGGCSIFLLPSTSEVILIDDGRICNYDSFYRNKLGAAFSQANS